MGLVKTTVEISDSLFGEAKAWAASRGVSFRQIVEEGIRSIIQGKGRQAPFRLRDASYGDSGKRTSRSWSEMRGMIYKGRGE
jgi:hypothetical protein